MGKKGRDLGTAGGDLGGEVAEFSLFIVDQLGSFGEQAEFIGLGR